jgi:stage III sporulation protein AE
MMQKEIRLHKKILRKKILRRIAAVMIMQGIIFFGKQTVLVKAATQNEQQEESTSLALQEQLLDEIQIDDMQKMLNEIMADHTFSVREALLNLINGEEPISKETVRSFLCSLFFSEMKNEKEMIWKLLLIILIAAVLAEFADVFGDGQVGSISFYIVYLALFMILMENFTRLGNVLSQRLMGLVNFMKVLSPAYFMTVTASTGAATAAVFYEGVLLMVWAIQWLLVNLFLPVINLSVLLKMVNHLSKEEMLSKMAELLDVAVSWGLKTRETLVKSTFSAILQGIQ